MADKEEDFELDPETLRKIEEEALKSVEDDFELDEETLREIEAAALAEIEGLDLSSPTPEETAPAPEPTPEPAAEAPAPEPEPTPEPAAEAPAPAPEPEPEPPKADEPATDEPIMVAPKAKPKDKPAEAPADKKPAQKADQPAKAKKPLSKKPSKIGTKKPLSKKPAKPDTDNKADEDEVPLGERTMMMTDQDVDKLSKEPATDDSAPSKSKKTKSGKKRRKTRTSTGTGTISTDKETMAKMRRGGTAGVKGATAERKSNMIMILVFGGCFVVLAGIVAAIMLSGNQTVQTAPTNTVPKKTQYELDIEAKEIKDAAYRKLNVELRVIKSSQTEENVRNGIALIEEFMATYPDYETKALEGKLSSYKTWLSMNSVAPSSP